MRRRVGTAKEVTTEVAQWDRSVEPRERGKLARECVLTRMKVFVREGQWLKQHSQYWDFSLSQCFCMEEDPHPVFTSI